mgnify:CR=1 FL=1
MAPCGRLRALRRRETAPGQEALKRCLRRARHPALAPDAAIAQPARQGSADLAFFADLARQPGDRTRPDADGVRRISSAPMRCQFHAARRSTALERGRRHLPCAMPAPWPMLGVSACAASPSSATRRRAQVALVHFLDVRAHDRRRSTRAHRTPCRTRESVNLGEQGSSSAGDAFERPRAAARAVS